MSEHLDLTYGGTATVGVGPIQPDNRRPVLLQVSTPSGAGPLLFLTWREARVLAKAMLQRAGGVDSEENGGEP